MKQLTRAIAIGILVTLALVSSSQPIRATGTIYQLSPQLATINLGGIETLQLNVQHASPTKNYTFVVNVTTPTRYQSVALTTLTTNATGDGYLTLNYPTDFFAYPRPPNTNVTGTYSIILYSAQVGGGSALALSSFQATSNLILNAPQAIDQNGSPINQLTAGGLVYFDFTASYLNGTPVTSAQASVSLDNGLPSALLLPASYSTSQGLFVTTQGYRVPENSSEVTLSISALVVDQAGNQGTSPISSLSLNLTPRNLLLTVLLAPLAILVGGSSISFYTLKNTKRSLPPEEIRKAVLQSGKRSVLITGRKRAGVARLLHAFLKEDLEAGIPSTYLTFETPPERLIAQLIKSRIDVLQGLQTGNLRILDCSDLSASLDLTTLRVRLASALSRNNSGKFALYIDSLTLPFEDLPSQEVLGFLGELNVEVVRERGVVYATAKLTRSIRKNLPSIRAVFDGLFEITPSSTSPDGTRLQLKGVNEGMERMPIGELTVSSDSGLKLEVPLTSNLEKKITES
jgi:archaellum biogenesis ATPase FlaH